MPGCRRAVGLEETERRVAHRGEPGVGLPCLRFLGRHPVHVGERQRLADLRHLAGFLCVDRCGKDERGEQCGQRHSRSHGSSSHARALTYALALTMYRRRTRRTDARHVLEDLGVERWIFVQHCADFPLRARRQNDQALLAVTRSDHQDAQFAQALQIGAVFPEEGLVSRLLPVIPLRADRDLDGKEARLDLDRGDGSWLGRSRQQAARQDDQRYAGDEESIRMLPC